MLSLIATVFSGVFIYIVVTLIGPGLLLRELLNKKSSFLKYILFALLCIWNLGIAVITVWILSCAQPLTYVACLGTIPYLYFLVRKKPLSAIMFYQLLELAIIIGGVAKYGVA